MTNGKGKGTVYPVHTMNGYGEWDRIGTRLGQDWDRIVAPQILSLSTAWR